MTNPLLYGELVLAIRPSGVRSLIQLGEGGVFMKKVKHKDIVAHNSGLVTVEKCTFRRPTLNEFTELMKRVPTPSYPKDAHTIVSLLDLGGGSHVLESGSGSGGLTLHLSRAGACTPLHDTQ